MSTEAAAKNGRRVIRNKESLIKNKTDNLKQKELFRLNENFFSFKNKNLSKFKIYNNETSLNSKLVNLLSTIANQKSSLHSIGPREINMQSSTKTISIQANLDQSLENYNGYEYSSDLFGYQNKYNPEVGLRTALVLGSMLISIVLYILWRNRYRCFGKGEHFNEDYNLDYWLQQVDKQKLAQSKSNYVLPKLPDAVTDSRQATEAWIFEHQKIWRNLKKTRNNPLAWPNRNYYLPIYERLTPTMNPENNLHKPLLDRFNIFKRKSERTKRQLAIKTPNRKKSAAHIDLDENTQLLINYARIDAKDSKAGRILLPLRDKSKADYSKTKTKIEEASNDNAKMHSILTRMFLNSRRRRHSWPRCKADYSYFNCLNKELRQKYDYFVLDRELSSNNMISEQDRSCSPNVKINSSHNAAASHSLLDTKV